MPLTLHNTAPGNLTELRFGLLLSHGVAFADDGFGEFVEVDLARTITGMYADLAEVNFGTFHEPAPSWDIPSLID